MSKALLREAQLFDASVSGKRPSCRESALALSPGSLKVGREQL
jgi:hypothetical protein